MQCPYCNEEELEIEEGLKIGNYNIVCPSCLIVWFMGDEND